MGWLRAEEGGSLHLGDLGDLSDPGHLGDHGEDDEDLYIIGAVCLYVCPSLKS